MLLRFSNLFLVLGLFCIFLAVAFIIYYPGLDAPMYYDSGAKLEARGYFFDHGILEAFKVFPQRPLPVLSFYINYLLTGMTPGFFRANNLLYLAALGLVVVLIFRLISEIPGLFQDVGKSDKKMLSALLGLAFLVHPIQTYQTLYIWQRMALMACVFSYASFAVYLAGRLGRIPSKLHGTILALLLFACAVLSKENSATLPFMILLAERAFFKQRWKDAFRATWPYLVTLIGLMLVLSYAQFPHGNGQFHAGILHTLDTYYRESGFTLTEHVLTQCRVLFSYLYIIIAPLPDRVQLIRLLGESRSLFIPPETFVAVVGVVCMVAGSLYLLRRRPLSGFGLCFYWVNLIPEAFLVPQYSFLAYRAVLPMLGIYLVAMDVFGWFLAARRQWLHPALIRSVVFGFLICAVILMGFSTHKRSSIWGDEVSFWSETIAGFPSTFYKGEARMASQTFTNLGTALYRQGRYAEAISNYDKALGLVPANAAALAMKGSAYAKQGKLVDAEASLRRALAADPNLWYAHEGLGNLLLSLHRDAEADRHLQKAAELTARKISR